MTALPSAPVGDRSALVDELMDLLFGMVRGIKRSLPTDVVDELQEVTPHQCEALVHVVREGDLTMNDLARSLAVSTSSATALADRVVRRGLVERGPDPDDRRVVRLRPTERGRRFVERWSAAKRDAALAWVEAIDDEELAIFVRLLRSMAERSADAEAGR